MDSRDRNPRVRLFNPSNEPVQVNIHRCLGTMEDVDDIGLSVQGLTEQPKVSLRKHGTKGSDDDGAELTELRAADPATELRETYLNFGQEIPEHLRTLVENTTTNLDNDEDREAITMLLLAYQDVFAKDDTDIGKTDVITHDVDTGRCKPVCQPLRRQSKDEHEAMVSIVNNLKRCGIIQPSKSQWAANIRMAKKKNGQWRMCIDYRDLNKRTVINDPYPLP